MEITLYKSAKDKLCDNLSLSFQDICELFTAFANEPANRTNKMGLPAFTYGRCEGTRSDKNVQFLSGISADFDLPVSDPNYRSFNDVCDILESNGKSYFAHTTASNSTSGNKYRVIMPFAHDVSADLYPAAWQKCHKMFRESFDESTKNVGRLFFLPSTFYGDDPKRRFSEEEGFNAFRFKVDGQEILSVQDIKNLKHELLHIPNKRGTRNAVVRCGLPDFSQGRSLDWEAWLIYADINRSPYIDPIWLNDCGDNRTFCFMLRAAGRAIFRRYPITPDILGMLGEQFESQILGRQPPELSELIRRAGDALVFVASNSAHAAKSAPDRIPASTLQKEA